jgi:hypothetical protein
MVASIIRAPSKRIHVLPQFWGVQPGTDYWFAAANADSSVTGAADVAGGLSGWGWTTTSLVFTNLVTADFFSSSDDTPPHLLANASGDLLASPAFFGSYSHRLLAGQILGYLPSKLCLEFYGAFTVASADEATTSMGWHNGAAVTASIYSNATNFLLYNGVTTDAGPAVDNAYHLWRIDTTFGGTHEWFVDGTSQGTLAITADVWPAAFVAIANTTNRFALAWVHAWFE